MRNSQFKKSLSVFIVVSIIISAFSFVYASGDEELQRYVVLLEEPALYSSDRPQVFGRNNQVYNNECREALIELQNGIKEQIPTSMLLNSDADMFDGEFSYTDVINGFTVTTDSKTAEAIKSICGVKEVFADEVIAYVTEDATPCSEDVTATETVFSAANPGNELNVQYAYEKGYNGEGQTVAILDSTINYENSYFKLTDETKVKYTAQSLALKMAEKGMTKNAQQVYKTAKVPYLYDYVNNTYSITSSSSQHGTHVSGIAAGYKIKVGDGIITGIAPEAQILFFGVTSSKGSISFSVAAAALDDAVKLEADTINMSFGGDYYSEHRTGSPYKALREAAENAKNAGCMLNKSAGNLNKGNVTETKDIDYSSTDNTLFPLVSNIGSVHGKYRVAKGLIDENGCTYGAESKSNISKFALTDIVDCNNGTDADIAAVNVTGKVAAITIPDEVLRETDITYYNRIAEKGATALLLINNGNQVAVSSSSNYYSIPVFYLTKSEGERLLSSAKQISCIGKLTITGNSEIVVASNFSSYGYSDSLDISVDYSAPGGNIYSSYGSSTAWLSGTSMAAPEASGAGLLMLQYVEEKYPSYTGQNKIMLVKNLLASTTETVYEENGAIASPRKVGSGIIQIDKAMKTNVTVHNENNNNRITLGDGIGKEFNLDFYVRNISDMQVTFDEILVELSTDDYKYYESKGIYAFCGIKKLKATVSGADRVTVTPNNLKKVSLTVTLDDEDITYLEKAMINGFFVDGKVTLSNSAGEHVSVGIPFAGFYGDWEKYSTVDETMMNKDFLFRTEMDYCTVDCVITKAEDGYILPFTTEPDERVKESALTCSLNTRRNSFLRIKSDGKVVYDGFAQKNLAINFKTFISKNETISAALKNKGKVVWEFYFMSPLRRTEEDAQKIIITVIPQNEKPEFQEIRMTETDGKKYMYVTVNGKAVSALVCVANKTNGDEKISRVYSNNFAAFSVDEIEDAALMVYDSALNSAVENAGITATADGDKVVFKNNTFKDIPAVGIIAVYSDEGKLENIDVITDENSTFYSYQKVEKDISDYNEKKYKIFFWEKNRINPYTEKIE